MARQVFHLIQLDCKKNQTLRFNNQWLYLEIFNIWRWYNEYDYPIKQHLDS